MASVSYHDTVKVLQDLPLEAGAAFDRAEWFALLAEEGGREPLVAVAQDDGGAVALPLMRQGKELVPLANWYSFYWHPLATSSEALERLLPVLARDLARQTGRITLWPIPEENGWADQVRSAFREGGWLTFAEPCDTNHILPLGGRDYAQYLAERPGPLRTTLKRKAKKLDVTIFITFSAIGWDIYEDIYARSWKPEEGKPAMLRRFAEQEGAAGRLRLGITQHDGEPVAAQLWTVENGAAYIHKLAHLEEAKPLSAGTVLTAALMERVIDGDRVETVDFGTGNDPYKREWMEAVRQRHRLTCLRPSRPANWPTMAKHWLRACFAPARWLEPPANAGEAMVKCCTKTEDESGKTDTVLRQVLCDVLGLAPERVAEFDAETGLFGELPELDSMAVAGLLTELEDRLGILIEDDKVDGEMLETFGALLAFAEAKLEKG